jgi:uncharacterized phiE125 gp8 family phage protein
MTPIYSLSLVTAPTEEPVDVTTAKTWLKVLPEQVEDDDLIQQLITAIRVQMEAEYNIAFITQTWKLYLHYEFPCGYGDTPWGEAIVMPKMPLASVTHVKYYDTADTLQTLTVSTDYVVDAVTWPGMIVPAYGKTWPTTRAKRKAVEVQFVCGYGASATVPADLKRELQVRLTHAYENRGLDVSPPVNVAVGHWPERRINV